MNTTQTITLPQEELEEMNAVLAGKAGIIGEHTVATYTAKFDFSIEVDVKICGVKERHDAEEDECTPYIDAVLFTSGHERQCIEPSFDRLDGEYIFDDPNDINNTLTVVIKGDSK